jgi:hypothetical protein
MNWMLRRVPHQHVVDTGVDRHGLTVRPAQQIGEDQLVEDGLRRTVELQ